LIACAQIWRYLPKINHPSYRLPPNKASG
jgi:hypothetical protein